MTGVESLIGGDIGFDVRGMAFAIDAVVDAPVPLPAPLPLLAFGVVALGGLARRRRG